MYTVRLINRWIDSFTQTIGVAVSWILWIMVFITIWDVVLRYGFKAGSVAVQNLEWYLFGINFLFAAAMNFKDDSNARIDIIYNYFGEKTKAAIGIIGDILLFIPYCIAVIWWSYPFVKSSWAVREACTDPGGLPCIYLIKTVIPVAFLILLIGVIPSLFKRIFIILDVEE